MCKSIKRAQICVLESWVESRFHEWLNYSCAESSRIRRMCYLESDSSQIWVSKLLHSHIDVRSCYGADFGFVWRALELWCRLDSTLEGFHKSGVEKCELATLVRAIQCCHSTGNDRMLIPKCDSNSSCSSFRRKQFWLDPRFDSARIDSSLDSTQHQSTTVYMVWSHCVSVNILILRPSRAPIVTVHNWWQLI